MKPLFIVFLIFSFISSSLYIPHAHADELNSPFMPKPGEMVHLSPEFTPAVLKGIVIHPENAFKFDFIVYKGDKVFTDSQKKEEYTKLIKYFLASLAVPDEDQWVNLSPYEKDRIIKDDFGKTNMGRDLLSQDYLLKQITASLIYPQDKLGRQFWDEIYARAYKQFGTTNIPINTCNKVWIVPDDADIYEKGNVAYLYKSHLKVMLEEDYLSLSRHSEGARSATEESKGGIHRMASQIVRQIILPQLEKEVNEGKNFAPLRQVFSGMVLAAWYKRALRTSLLDKIYANKDKVKGIDQDPRNNEAIYQQYLKAYQKGVFNFIKEEALPVSGVPSKEQEILPRKYFSGGWAAPQWDGARGVLHRHPANDVSAAMSAAVDLRTNGTKVDLAAVSLDPNQYPVSGIANAAMTAEISVHPIDEGNEHGYVWNFRDIHFMLFIKPTVEKGRAILGISIRNEFKGSWKWDSKSLVILNYQGGFPAVEQIVTHELRAEIQEILYQTRNFDQVAAYVAKVINDTTARMNLNMTARIDRLQADPNLVHLAETMGDLNSGQFQKNLDNLKENIAGGSIDRRNKSGAFLKIWDREHDGIDISSSWRRMMKLIIDAGGYDYVSFEKADGPISWGIRLNDTYPETVQHLQDELLQWLDAFKIVMHKAQDKQPENKAMVSGRRTFIAALAGGALSMAQPRKNVSNKSTQAKIEKEPVLPKVDVRHYVTLHFQDGDISLGSFKADLGGGESIDIEITDMMRAKGPDGFFVYAIAYSYGVVTPGAFSNFPNRDKIWNSLIQNQYIAPDRKLKSKFLELKGPTDMSLPDIVGPKGDVLLMGKIYDTLQMAVRRPNVGNILTKGDFIDRLNYEFHGNLLHGTPIRPFQGFLKEIKPGGIDLNAFHLNLHIKRDGNGVPLPVSQQDLENIHIDGLVPVILKITPASTSAILMQLSATTP